jgi:hypothetical protein
VFSNWPGVPFEPSLVSGAQYRPRRSRSPRGRDPLAADAAQAGVETRCLFFPPNRFPPQNEDETTVFETRVCRITPLVGGTRDRPGAAYARPRLPSEIPPRPLEPARRPPAASSRTGFRFARTRSAPAPHPWPSPSAPDGMSRIRPGSRRRTGGSGGAVTAPASQLPRHHAQTPQPSPCPAASGSAAAVPRRCHPAPVRLAVNAKRASETPSAAVADAAPNELTLALAHHLTAIKDQRQLSQARGCRADRFVAGVCDRTARFGRERNGRPAHAGARSCHSPHLAWQPVPTRCGPSTPVA